MKKTLTLILFFIVSSLSGLYAKNINPMIQAFENIDTYLCYHPSEAEKQLDSLLTTFSLQQKDEYKNYIQYVNGFLLYQKGDYDKSLELADSALIGFLWTKNIEWEARALFLIGIACESTRLNSEALEAYSFAIKQSTDTLLLCRAEFGLARSLKRKRKDWKFAYEKGVAYAEKSGQKELQLLAGKVFFFFYPDSGNYEKELSKIALQYDSLGLLSYTANTQKMLAVYLEMDEEYEQAIIYIDKAIDNYLKSKRKVNIYLASMYFTKGSIHYNLGESKDAYQNFNKTIAIYDSALCCQNNYSTYNYLFSLDTLAGDYKAANYKLIEADHCLWTRYNLGLKRAKKMATLFTNRQMIIEEVRKMDAKRRIRNFLVLCLSFVIIAFSVFKVMQYRKKHLQLNKQVKGLEKERKKILDDSGGLMMKIAVGQQSKQVIESFSQLQHKIDNYVLENSKISSDLKERYADVMLCFKKKLSMLTESELRYATLLAFGIPAKHIADILNVKVESVKRNRNYIRRKLGIANTDVSLREKLNSYLD